MAQKLFLIILAVLLAFPAAAEQTLKIGSRPPSFSLPNLANENVAANKYFGKGVVILNFFASWSNACKEEEQFLNELHNRYKDQGLKIIGISFDKKAEPLKSFLESNKIKFDVLRDKNLTTLKDFRILIIPTIFVIDKSGALTNIYVDFDGNVKEALSKEINKLLTANNKS